MAQRQTGTMRRLCQPCMHPRSGCHRGHWGACRCCLFRVGCLTSGTRRVVVPCGKQASLHSLQVGSATHADVERFSHPKLVEQKHRSVKVSNNTSSTAASIVLIVSKTTQSIWSKSYGQNVMNAFVAPPSPQPTPPSLPFAPAPRWRPCRHPQHSSLHATR